MRDHAAAIACCRARKLSCDCVIRAIRLVSSQETHPCLAFVLERKAGSGHRVNSIHDHSMNALLLLHVECSEKQQGGAGQQGKNTAAMRMGSARECGGWEMRLKVLSRTASLCWARSSSECCFWMQAVIRTVHRHLRAHKRSTRTQSESMSNRSSHEEEQASNTQH